MLTTALPIPSRLRLVRQALYVLLSACLATPLAAQHARDAYDSGAYDADAAVATSQAAIGRPLGDHVLTDSEGQTVTLADYRGRPLLISIQAKRIAARSSVTPSATRSTWKRRVMVSFPSQSTIHVATAIS